jgi:hypothetical protein
MSSTVATHNGAGACILHSTGAAELGSNCLPLFSFLFKALMPLKISSLA